jgi:parallel beta-helix repeat protein
MSNISKIKSNFKYLVVSALVLSVLITSVSYAVQVGVLTPSQASEYISDYQAKFDEQQALIDEQGRNITALQNQLDQPVGSTLSASRKTASFVVSFATNTGTPDYTLVLQSGVNGSMVTLGNSATNYTYIAEKAINAATAINGSIYFCEGRYITQAGVAMTVPTIPAGVSVTFDSGAYGYILGTVQGTLSDYNSLTFYRNGTQTLGQYSPIVYEENSVYKAQTKYGNVFASSTNLTAVTLSALNSGITGNLLLNGVAFDLALFNSIPESVSVVENVNGRERTFGNIADTQGSPYTISVEDTQYFAQDSIGTIRITSTDAYATIQNAETLGDTLVADGSYSLFHPVLLNRANAEVKLSKNAVITDAINGDGHTMFNVTANNCTLTGGQLKGASATIHGTGVTIAPYVINAKVNNMVLSDIWQYGISVGVNSVGAKIEYNTLSVIGTKGDGISINVQGKNVLVSGNSIKSSYNLGLGAIDVNTGAAAVTVTENIIDGTTDSGIEVEVNATSVIISNNQVFNSLYGITAYHCAGVYANNTIIANNIVANITNAPIQAIEGSTNILITGNSVDASKSNFGIRVQESTGTIISENTVFSSSGLYAAIDIVNSTFVTVVRNNINKPLNEAIHVQTTSMFITIDGNTVTNCTSTTKDAILVENTQYPSVINNIISNNAETGNKAGIHLNYCDYSKMSGNTLVDCRQGIEYTYCINGLICDNLVVNPSVGTFWDISLNGAQNTNIYISRNQLSALAAINNAGTNCTIAPDNIFRA